MNDFIVIPGTGIRLYDGYIVTLADYPGDTFIVKHGYYKSSEASAVFGWYFISITTPLCLEATDELLLSVNILKPNYPNPEIKDMPFTPQLYQQLLSAFITVDNLTDLDNLLWYDIPNGKLVKVNDVGDSKVGYYTAQVDGDNISWVEVPSPIAGLGIHGSSPITITGTLQAGDATVSLDVANQPDDLVSLNIVGESLGVNSNKLNEHLTQVNQRLNSAEHTISSVTGFGVNIFNKDAVTEIAGYINEGLNPPSIQLSSNAHTVYLPCSPNTTYTVSKIKSNRFIIGFTAAEPARDVPVYNIESLKSAQSLTSTSTADSNYLVIFCYVNPADPTDPTEPTFQDVINSLQVELGSIASPYQPYRVSAVDFVARTIIDDVLDSTARKITGESYSVSEWRSTNKFVDYNFIELLDVPHNLVNLNSTSAWVESVLYKGHRAIRCIVDTDTSLTHTIQLRFPYSTSSFLSLMGTQEFDLAIYIPDVTLIGDIQIKCSSRDSIGNTKSYTFLHQYNYNLKSGWNYIRFAVGGVAGNIWDAASIISVAIIPADDIGTDPIVCYIGSLLQVKPNKAKLIVVDDHGYQEFMNNAYIPYLKPAQIPVTWGIQPGRLGTYIEGTGTLLTADNVKALADDAYSEISWHSYDSTNTSTMSVDELRQENMKCISAIRKLGVLPEHFWRCAWKQNDAPNAMSCADQLSAFAYYSQPSRQLVFPFFDRYSITRYGIHYYTTELIDDHYPQLDSIFEVMKKTHNIYVMYTHSCLEDITTVGAGSITPSQAQYFANLCTAGMNEGWLECTTYNQLCIRYGY